MHITHAQEAEAGPSCVEVMAKASLEILGLLVLILPMAYVYVFTKNYEPFKRGFFCDDQNLKHPYSEQQVPIVVCVALWGAVAALLIDSGNAQKAAGDVDAALRAYAEAKGQTAATTSAAAVNPNFGVDAGLVPGTGAVQQADAESAASAQRMRQALTLQLRQTLTSVTASDTRSLNEKVSQLESMKAGQ